MEILFIYLAIAYSVLFLDAALTIGLRLKYVFWKSLLGALFFPITTFIPIVMASHLTKDFPDAKTIFEDKPAKPVLKNAEEIYAEFKKNAFGKK